jgi:nitric oxide reductase subunit B
MVWEREAAAHQRSGASTSAWPAWPLLTLLPLGILQLIAAIEHGYWYARSAEFMQQPIVEMLVWMRVPGDTIFSVGALALAWFVLRLWIAPRRDPAFSGSAEHE